MGMDSLAKLLIYPRKPRIQLQCEIADSPPPCRESPYENKTMVTVSVRPYRRPPERSFLSVPRDTYILQYIRGYAKLLKQHANKGFINASQLATNRKIDTSTNPRKARKFKVFSALTHFIRLRICLSFSPNHVKRHFNPNPIFHTIAKTPLNPNTQKRTSSIYFPTPANVISTTMPKSPAAQFAPKPQNTPCTKNPKTHCRLKKTKSRTPNKRNFSKWHSKYRRR